MAMTAAPVPREEPLVPIDEMPATKAANETLRARQQELNVVEEQLARFRQALNPTLATEETPEQIWEAKFGILEAEREHARLSLAVATARRAAEHARDADRETLRARILAQKRRVFETLLPAMQAAEKEMLALQQLEIREAELLGNVDRCAWPSLCANDVGLHALDTWLAYVRTAGLLD